MDLFSIFKGGKYFDKHIEPKCDYCQFGRRAKDGEKVICEKRGLVQRDDSCSKFIYSPLKRIPVKQLNFVGSLADEDMYTESASDIAEKQEELLKSDDSKKSGRKAVPDKKEESKEESAETPSVEVKEEEKPAEKPTESEVHEVTEESETTETAETAEKSEEPEVSEESEKSE